MAVALAQRACAAGAGHYYNRDGFGGDYCISPKPGEAAHFAQKRLTIGACDASMFPLESLLSLHSTLLLTSPARGRHE
ncbi:hypothetical protein AWB64_04445 [Caballeronia sordidicola]|uniref:Uncharacterized protein n=1 Tax=Caballeronia sordidicola TaxID=196367 RepID=A0A158HCL2_CABSO|nr:hypothetical protein [Caballeronia sordidicola]SAL41701.1 hypothetical protein AWB64_04445 [Caballeronia sordidicola]